MKTLFMETTKVPVGQTVARIQQILGEYGVCAVMTEYKDKEAVAVCFKIMFLNKDIPFKLPCRWDPIWRMFMNRPRKRQLSSDEAAEWKEQAKRVAWRQILRWVEAQLALVDTDMVKVHEVFLPYMQVGINGETVADRFTSGNLLLENKS